jgi:hypothetical protein
MLASMSGGNVGNSDDYLQKRYGTSRKAGRRWIIPAALLLIVGGGWLLWSANHYSRPEIRTDLISFSVAGSNNVHLRYFISVRNSNRSHQCILKASDYQANTVGQITDTIPPGAHRYTRTVDIPTRLQAVSASIEHCS